MVYRTEKIGIFVAMMTLDQYRLLSTPELREAVERNLGRNPLDVALDKRLPEAALVATQVKCLARAKAKLPSFCAARCILPPRAFEQASSEECAAGKRIGGDRVLDLTCGLGVDALALSRRFGQVTALERDPVLARITADNLQRMGASNVEVICTSAEEYLRSTDRHFDWVYADPDRRDAAGRRRVLLEDCSPDVRALLPDIERVAGRLCLKNSPLFDVDEAFRIFGRCGVEVVSLRDECKEVVVYADGREPEIGVVALGRGECRWPLAAVDRSPAARAFDPSLPYRWLVIPDVALQKSRTVCHRLRGQADLWSDNGYGFAVEAPSDPLVRLLEIERVEPYDPRALKRELHGRRMAILKRDFPLQPAEIAARLGIREGGEAKIAFTKIGARYWTIRLKQ